MIHHITRATRHLIFWSLLILALGSIGIRLGLLAVEHYKTELEQKIAELGGVKVKIGSLRGGVQGINPEIILRNISILSQDKEGQSAIQLEQIRVGVNVFQFIQSRDVLASTWITLVGTRVTVIRDKQGNISIKGLAVSEDAIPAWMLSFRHYEILDTEVIWRDQQHPPQSFKDVDFLLKSDESRRDYDIHALALLPPPYHGSLRLSARLQGDLFAANVAAGDVYIEGKNVALPEALSQSLIEDAALTSEAADFKIWLQWQERKLYTLAGQWTGAELKLKQAQTEQIFDNVAALFSWQRQQQGSRLDVVDLQLQKDDKVIPAMRFSVVFRENSVAGVISTLDLTSLRFFTPFMPADWLSAYSLTKWRQAGLLQNTAFYVDYTGNTYALSGQFEHLSLDLSPNYPSFSGLSGTIQGDNDEGVLKLDSEAGSVTFSDLFRDPLQFKQIQGGLSWKQSEQSWLLQSHQLRLKTKEMDAVAALSLRVPKKAQHAIEMDMRLGFDSYQRVQNIGRYLPTGIMNKDLVHWLDNAAISGVIKNGRMRLQGPLDQFPFQHGHGKFEVLFDLNDGVLQYSPVWPRLSQLNARVHFLANTLQIDIDHAHSKKLSSHFAQVVLPDLEKGERVQVKAKVDGKVDDFLHFLQQTPLHGTIDNVIDAMQAKGKTQVAFNLDIPLLETAKNFHIAGHFHLNQASLQLKSLALPIENIHGTVTFTERGLFSDQIKGTLARLPLQADISSDAQAVRIRSRGKMKTAVLYQLFPALKNDTISGVFNYKAIVTLPDQAISPINIDVYSNLKGVALPLPAQLGKTRQDVKKLALNIKLKKNQNKKIYLNYADLFKAALVLEGEASHLKMAHVLIGKGKARFLAAPGIYVDMRLQQLHVEQWLAALTAVLKGKNNATDVRRINLAIDQVWWEKRQLGPLKLQLNPGKQFWQGELDCQIARGELLISVRQNIDKITLQLDELNLDALLASYSDEGGAIDSDPGLMPLFDIYAKKLIVNGRDQGMLLIETARQDEAIAFKRISLVGEYGAVDMTGHWRNTPVGVKTELTGKLHSQDFSMFLDRLGFANDLRDTSAMLDFSLDWVGAPYQVALETLEGNVEFKLHGGRIASIEPGVGRLLGLIAIQQWVKRFSLDFTDIYQKGLAYNQISGRFELTAGIARTQNLLIDAIAARIKVAGLLNLAQKTINAHVWVVPKSSAAVPIAGTIISGIASALTRAIDEDYKEGYFFGSEYKVTGKWSDAKVTPLHENDGVIRKFWQNLMVSPK